MHNRSPKKQPLPTKSKPNNKIQLIDFTYCHDMFPNMAIETKHQIYNPLINTIKQQGWDANPIITIMGSVCKAIHQHSIQN